MFKRRKPLPTHSRMKEAIWPRRGWARASRYIGHRLGRLPGSPYRIAAGFACGAAVSFTPFIGFHFVLAMGASLLLRGNIIASAIGTAVGNPWTFPFIWAWVFTLGRWILGEDAETFFPNGLTLAYIFDNPWKVLWPMSVGAVPSMIVVWLVFFFPAQALVAQYQRARRRRLRKKLIRRRAKLAKAAAALERQGGAGMPS